MSMDDARPAGVASPRGPTSRRRYERLALTGCTVEVFRSVLFGIREKPMPYHAVGVDLSEVGMRLSVPERLDIGDHLRLVVHLDLFQDTVEGECNVVWCASNARVGGECLVGIEWTRLVSGHYAKIQHIRRIMRTKEFQQKLLTKNRVKKEQSDGTDELEFRIPPL